MFCVYCGVKNTLSGALFCSNCGKQLNSAIAATGIKEIRPKAWLAWPFWLLLFCFVGAVMGYLLPSHGRPLSQSFSGPLLTGGALLAYVWKKRGLNVWAGFVLGLLMSVGLLMVSSFSFGAWKFYRPTMSADEFLDAEKVPNAILIEPDKLQDAASVPMPSLSGKDDPGVDRKRQAP
ncbi:hypothetical protein DBR47_06270 [Paucibacter sp. KBW04]|uniref:zinc ribbon domain-containing protein n=1 Tax=Paucibacter sp. KBW04 TaxID=2153361 RepID=UPI000F579D85|nr:zinc ribbon domain-containing protein [Paucibacter sp. KBW04]RQO61749.1 hypothetical protein DBR47_06270 [Paucibacter sp. KBW04]